MESSHFELRFQLNFNQVTTDWQRRSFLKNKSPIISLDASYGELEDYLRDMQKIIQEQKESFSCNWRA